MEPVKGGKSEAEHSSRHKHKSNYLSKIFGLIMWIIEILQANTLLTGGLVLIALITGFVLIKDHGIVYLIAMMVAGALIWCATCIGYYDQMHKSGNKAPTNPSQDLPHNEPPANALIKSEPHELALKQEPPPVVNPQPEPVAATEKPAPAPVPEATQQPLVLSADQRRQLIDELRTMGANNITITANSSYEPARYAGELAGAFTTADWHTTTPPKNPGGTGDNIRLRLSIPETGDRRRYLRLARILWKCGIPAQIQPTENLQEFLLNIERVEENPNINVALGQMMNAIDKWEDFRFISERDLAQIVWDLIFLDKKTRVQVYRGGKGEEVGKYTKEIAQALGSEWEVPGVTGNNFEPKLTGLKILASEDDAGGVRANVLSKVLTDAHIKNFVDSSETAHELSVTVGADWRTPEEKKETLEQPLKDKKAAEQLRDSISVVNKSITLSNEEPPSLTFNIELKNQTNSPLRIKSAMRFGSQPKNDPRKIPLPELNESKLQPIAGPESSITLSAKYGANASERFMALGRIWFLDNDRNIVALEYRYWFHKGDNGFVIEETDKLESMNLVE